MIEADESGATEGATDSDPGPADRRDTRSRPT